MEWVVLLPVIVSIALTVGVFICIYKIPPGWVSRETDKLDGLGAGIDERIDRIEEKADAYVEQFKAQAADLKTELKSFANPHLLGDAIHHAVTKNDAEILTIVGEEANGIVHEAIPVFSERLAGEAVGLVSSMYTKGVAKDMGQTSGAARGYLALPGIQKAALKTGAESMLGGALGNFLPPEIAGMLSPEMIQGFLTNALNPGNGPQQGGPVEQAKSEWRPPV